MAVISLHSVYADVLDINDHLSSIPGVLIFSEKSFKIQLLLN